MWLIVVWLVDDNVGHDGDGGWMMYYHWFDILLS